MNKHDQKEIEKLKQFREWIIWYRSLTEAEKKEYFKTRFKNS